VFDQLLNIYQQNFNQFQLIKCQIKDHFEPTMIHDHGLILHFEIQGQKNNLASHQAIYWNFFKIFKNYLSYVDNNVHESQDHF
jgi:hypothetical protein